jgi:hypothetical protein
MHPGARLPYHCRGLLGWYAEGEPPATIVQADVVMASSDRRLSAGLPCRPLAEQPTPGTRLATVIYPEPPAPYLDTSARGTERSGALTFRPPTAGTGGCRQCGRRREQRPRHGRGTPLSTAMNLQCPMTVFTPPRPSGNVIDTPTKKLTHAADRASHQAACAAASVPDGAGAVRRSRAPCEAQRRSPFPRRRSRRNRRRGKTPAREDWQ